MTIIDTNRPPVRGLSAFVAWFEQHAGEHRGSWVAVLEGELLGTAPSHAALIEKIGSSSADPNIIISQVP